jgi:hypothetical protein
LWRIVKRALERDPDDRYANAAEFARALDAWVEEQGTADEMPELLGAILESLFPGERKRQAMWLRSNSARTTPARATMAPPAPVAASVSMPPPLPPASKRPPRSVPKMRARKPSGGG